MKRAPLLAALALLGAGWVAAPLGMTGHMIAHMIAVAVAAPLLSLAVRGTPLDPAQRWPRIVTPFAMSMVELALVWSWHVPALRAAAAQSLAVMVVEQLSFLGAGGLLWSAVLARPAWARASGVGVLLLTSMHMTLLGALIALAPRPLYAAGHGSHGAMALLDPMQDQQLSGVVMLLVGGAAYLIGGLAVLGGLLRQEARA